MCRYRSIVLRSYDYRGKVGVRVDLVLFVTHLRHAVTIWSD